MKPHKKSIRDFFSSAPRTPQSSQDSQTALPQANATNPPVPASQSGPVHTPANPAPSRRIIFNRKDVVPNSDSDDDDDSLPDLDFNLPPHKSKPLATPTAHIATRSKRTSDNDEDGLRKPTKKLKDDKRKFNSLVRTTQKKLETEREIQERKAVLDEAEQEPATAKVAINEETLGQVLQDDDDGPEKAHRLLQAMQRTNATQMESVFYFFKDTADAVSTHSKFPITAFPQQRWVSAFQNANTRHLAFMTGFAQQIFRTHHLPEELASWMIDQIRYSQSEVLNCKYLEILEAHHEHLHTLLDSQRLDAMFSTIGANLTQFEAHTQLAPISVPRFETKTLLPPSLKSIAALLARSAPWLHTAARNHALYLLCHVCLDTRVATDSDMLRTIQDAVEALICHFADNNKLISGLNAFIPQLLTKVTHPVLQRNLICALPATSPLTAYLQRHLALSFLVHPLPVQISLADQKAHDLVLEHVAESPHFFINKNTDYGLLAARLALLDIVIGPGLLTVPYQPLSSSTPTQTDSCPVEVPVPASSEVKHFNQQVDALARQMKLLGNSIVEAGAVVDITILETKNSIEQMCARLEHASRIGGKKIDNVFGSDEEDAQPRVDRFFKRALKPSAPPHGIFNQTEDADIDFVDPTQS
ncbi:uncharacterized protein SETTUDRAFT_45165 [Exserohilum turcica Et28A]|uniref:Uncharacterized protein n=1 Tax=Exserohilum turcicum (strain 28A) TaxID=671987 RepID=R0KSY5_EXST2|nr:uncharacterized protein SETTUDRAFT_45165 [Exserohilum turcica Et28A]EOA90927.1 hypothetical protein SETTUDRAFT_45165 [Exserohilum turcica Et28A]